jgi:hypothetical protein
MTKVFADDEEVIFQEGTPKDPAEVFELLMNAFAQRRRALTSFEVDGSDCLHNEEFPASFLKITSTSLTHAEITMRLSIQLINQLSNFEKEISAYQINLLVTPWSEVFTRTDEFITKIQPFADLVDNIIPFAQSYEPSWSKKIYEIAKLQAESLNRILKSFEHSNPSGLSDELAVNFLPVFQKAHKLFEEIIIPDLKNRIEEDSQPEGN